MKEERADVQSACVRACVQAYIPEFVLEHVLGTNVGLSFPSRSPAASQVFGVPGPAGQIDRPLWRHWGKERGGRNG